MLAVILQKLLPLYLLVGVGFVCGRKLKLETAPFGRLLIYFFTPTVVFTAVMNAKLTSSLMALPILFYLLCTAICLLTYFLSAAFVSSPTRNLLAFAAGNANSGYFAIPVGASLFGEQAVGVIVLCSFGFILYENTVGYFITARGKFDSRDSLRRVLRLPAIYAFAAALLLNLMGVGIPEALRDTLTNGARRKIALCAIFWAPACVSMRSQQGSSADIAAETEISWFCNFDYC